MFAKGTLEHTICFLYNMYFFVNNYTILLGAGYGNNNNNNNTIS